MYSATKTFFSEKSIDLILISNDIGLRGNLFHARKYGDCFYLRRGKCQSIHFRKVRSDGSNKGVSMHVLRHVYCSFIDEHSQLQDLGKE